MIHQMQQFSRKKSNILALGIAFIAAYMLFQGYFENNAVPTVYADGYSFMSIDTSWTLAVNYAIMKNLSWGKDIAFTYRTIIVSATAHRMGQSKYSFLLFDLFFAFNLICIFYGSLKNGRNKLIVASLLILAVLLIPERIEGAYSLLFFMFLIFWARKNIDNPGHRQLHHAMSAADVAILPKIQYRTYFFCGIFRNIGISCTL
ncbi:hypothetical protein [Flavobacterium sp. 3HN19-14]|uniref:hypothetical protein n=1 Tax=Flavobacterium sp. 3HN19-14 TaxID=3448133 RepID=UPI003EDF6527